MCICTRQKHIVDAAIWNVCCLHGTAKLVCCQCVGDGVKTTTRTVNFPPSGVCHWLQALVKPLNTCYMYMELQTPKLTGLHKTWAQALPEQGMNHSPPSTSCAAAAAAAAATVTASPLQVNWRKGSTVLSTTDDGCGNKLGLSVKNKGKTLVDTPPCNPTAAPARVNAAAGGLRPAAAVAPQTEGPIGVAGPIRPVGGAVRPMSMPVVEP
jgi:hypothetical protein